MYELMNGSLFSIITVRYSHIKHTILRTINHNDKTLEYFKRRVRWILEGARASTGLCVDVSSGVIQFNSIQNSLFSTQHIVHTTMFLAYDVLKRERAEDSAYVGSFPNIII